MPVGRGFHESSFETIDTGIVRPCSTTLGILGEPNRTVLSAALLLLWRYRERKMHSKLPVSTPAQLALLLREPGIRDSVAFIAGGRWHRLAAPGVLAFCHYLIQERDPARVGGFFEQIRSGAGLQPGDPVLALRNRLISDRSNDLERNEVIALIFTAWNAYAEGKPIKRLRVPLSNNGRVVIPQLV